MTGLKVTVNIARRARRILDRPCMWSILTRRVEIHQRIFVSLVPTAINRLRMNQERVLIARKRWITGGFHPPDFG
jgi:hypothetical protein